MQSSDNAMKKKLPVFELDRLNEINQLRYELTQPRLSSALMQKKQDRIKMLELHVCGDTMPRIPISEADIYGPAPEFDPDNRFFNE
jgi:hypothetical protein